MRKTFSAFYLIGKSENKKQRRWLLPASSVTHIFLYLPEKCSPLALPTCFLLYIISSICSRTIHLRQEKGGRQTAVTICCVRFLYITYNIINILWLIFNCLSISFMQGKWCLYDDGGIPVRRRWICFVISFTLLLPAKRTPDILLPSLRFSISIYTHFSTETG